MRKPALWTAGLMLAIGASGQPGEGVHLGQWTLSPSVDVGAFYDSNVYQQDDESRDDVFLDSTLIGRASYAAFDVDLMAMGFVSARSYASVEGKDFGAFGDVVKLRHGNRETVLLEADQSFRRVEDIDVYGAEAAVGGISPDSVLDAVTRSQRDVCQVGTSVAKNLTDKMAVEGGYRFDSVTYDDPGLQDLSSHAGEVETSHQVTDKTAAFVRLKGGQQMGEALDDPAEYWAVWAGMKTRNTDKLTLKAGAGTQWYDQPENQGEKVGATFDVSGAWLATDRLTLQSGARNGIQLTPLYADNAVDFTFLWLGGTYKVARSIVLSGNAVYRVDDYLEPVDVGNALASRVDRAIAARFRADYLLPAKFMRVYGELTGESVNSTFKDYNETRAGVGVELRY